MVPEKPTFPLEGGVRVLTKGVSEYCFAFKIEKYDPPLDQNQAVKRSQGWPFNRIRAFRRFWRPNGGVPLTGKATGRV